MRWKIKAALQRIAAKLPYPYYWYGLAQQYLTRSICVTGRGVERRLQACRMHLAHFGHVGEPFDALEIGTGWIPVVPLGLWLCGARAIVSYDMAPLATEKRLLQCIRAILVIDARGNLTDLLPHLRPERLERLKELGRESRGGTAAAFFSRLGVTLLVGRRRLNEIEGRSFDIVISHEVLEYVPTEELARLFLLFSRVTSGKAVLSHYIDLRDEYSYGDASLSPLHFLRYTSAEWNRAANPLFPLNRLRLPAYRDLFARAGFQITDEETQLAEATALEGFSVAAEFQDLSDADLLPLNAWVRAVRAKPAFDGRSEYANRDAF